MKILIISQSVNPIVQALLPSGHEIVGIIENAQRGQKNPKKKTSVVGKFKEIIKKTFGLKKGPNLSAYSKANNIPYRFMVSSNDDGLDEWIKSINTELIVVYSMSSLLTREIFEIPKFGTINIHPSFLPDYRGPKPCFWHYYDLVLDPGVTVHFIDAGEDTGDIICQERVNIQLGMKNQERIDLLVGKVGVRLLLEALPKIESGTVQRLKQNIESPTRRARNVKVNEHTQLIDWQNWSGKRIWHVLRGTEQWLNALPQPSGLYRGTRWSIEEYIPEEVKTEPGRLFKENGKQFVATKDGKILLQRNFSFLTLFRTYVK